jgi:phosphate-selective porin OprO/OprP
MKTLAFATIFVLHSTVTVSSAWPTDIDSQLQEFRQRIDALEVENKSLREAISKPAAQPTGPYLSADDQIADKPTEYILESLIQEPESELASAPPDCPLPTSNRDDLPFTGAWNHGLEFTTKNKEFRVHVGGRTQFDAAWFRADENVQDNINKPYEDGADFRRARLRIDGTMFYTIDWAAEYDFVNSFEVDDRVHTVTGLTDMWWTFREVPCFGNVRIGNQKPPIGFEHLVSSRFLPFMERSYNQDAFYGGVYNGFQPGVVCFDNYGEENSGLWQAGVFKPTDNVFASAANDGDYSFVGRLTHLAWYDCDGARLLHIGGSAMTHTTVEGEVIYRTRDAIRSGLSADWPVPASTGRLAGDEILWLNGEVAGVYGPWTFQSEYIVSNLNDAAAIVGNVVQPSVGNVTYHGGYAQVLYFLTGEHDNYNKTTGVFDRVIPYDNFYFRNYGVESGPGAWQIGARYNFLDLNDATLDGGILHNVTCGLNWFLNPNLKIQFDYMATHRDAPLAGDLGDGWIHGFGIRVAHDF